MWMLRRVLLCLAIVTICAVRSAPTTDLFYSDSVAISPNGRYKAEAKSPDNRWGQSKRPFQENFVYTLTDTIKRRVLWKRKQGAQEGSCGSLFVDDDGWVIISTGWSNLIFVSPSGDDTGKVNILNDGLTAAERKQYVHDTTAGPMWAGFSHWYFLQVGEQRIFVIRPWWNRRMIADLEKGRFIPETGAISKACEAAESRYVMEELNTAVRNLKLGKLKDCCEAQWPALKSTYLAGKLGLVEAVPLIRELELSSYSGSSTSGWSTAPESNTGEIDPHSYSTFTLRQVTQLSLRRLGEIPRQLPVYEFQVQYKKYEKNHYFKNPELPYPRHTRADAIKAGMRAKDVLTTIGSPDYVTHDTWEYDMDTKPAYTLVLSWDERHVTKISKKSPATWRDGRTRDEHLAY